MLMAGFTREERTFPAEPFVVDSIKRKPHHPTHRLPDTKKRRRIKQARPPPVEVSQRDSAQNTKSHVFNLVTRNYIFFQKKLSSFISTDCDYTSPSSPVRRRGVCHDIVCYLLNLGVGLVSATYVSVNPYPVQLLVSISPVGMFLVSVR
jgi:hypothetical protein